MVLFGKKTKEKETPAPAKTPEELAAAEKPVKEEVKMNYALKFYEPGGVVFYQGEFGDCFYDVLQGAVGVYINYGTMNEELITTKGVGDYFGEMAIIEACPRTATIVALESSTMVRKIDGSCLLQYAQENPENIMRIMMSMGARVNKMSRENNRLRGVMNALLEKHPSIRKLTTEEAKAARVMAASYIPEK